MKTIIETGSYPAKIVLVPETEQDHETLKELRFHFYEDENSEVEVSCGDIDDISDYGENHLVFQAVCNLS